MTEELHKIEVDVPFPDDTSPKEVSSVLCDMVDAEVRCTSYEDGTATLLSTEPIEVVFAETDGGVPLEPKDPITPTQMKIFHDIHQEFVLNPGSGGWTPGNVLQVTDVTESLDEVRCAIQRFTEHGWTTVVDESRSGQGIYEVEIPR